MQNAPSASPTSKLGVQLACGARICCNSQSPSPIARNMRTLLSSKEAATRCSPSHSNPQMQRMAVGRRCVFAAAPNGRFVAPGVRHNSCTADEPRKAQNTLPLGPVANDEQLIVDSCRVTVCTSANCSDALRRRTFTQIASGLAVCSVVTMSGRLGLSFTANSPISFAFDAHENTCREQRQQFSERGHQYRSLIQVNYNNSHVSTN